MNKEYGRKVETKRISKQRQKDEETKVKKSENRYLTVLFIPKSVKIALIMTTDPRCHVAARFVEIQSSDNVRFIHALPRLEKGQTSQIVGHATTFTK